MDTDILSDFVCLAQTLNFREAAERRYISQSALSRRIHALEDEMGVLLFERNTRKVKLTVSGTVCLTETMKVLDALTDMLNQVHSTALGQSGSLNIGYCETGNNPYLSKLMLEMKTKYPSICIRVYEDDIYTLRRDIISGKVDALMLLKPTVIDLTELEYQIIKPESPCILLPSNHSLANSKTIRIEQVKNEPVFMFHREKSQQLYDKLLDVWLQTGLTPNLVPAQDRQISVLVAAGEGILLCPSNEQNTIDTPPGTVRIPIAGKYRDFDRVLCWHKDNTNPALRILRSVMAGISRQINYCE